MIDLIVIAILLVIVGGAIAYIRKQKKNGAACIGCPHAGACAKRREGSCDSHVELTKK